MLFRSAVRSTRHGLALAQRIQARAQARQAHLQLAQLLQAQGDADGALDHLWQHLALQSEIERLSLPARATLAAPPAEDAGAPVTPEELLLQLSGHDTRVAYSGPQALAMAADLAPQLVFLDIGMPGMDGYEVARALRQDERTRHAMLVALTGWGAEDDRERTRDAGFDHHLTKPADPLAIDAVLLAADGRAAR